LEPGEVESALGSAAASTFDRIYGVTRTGNFEGRTILRTQPGWQPTAEETTALRSMKQELYAARLKRPRPSTDTKILTSWNGLAISSIAFAAAALGDRALAGTAEKAADFVLRTNVKNGRLLRRYAGGEAALEGTLEDYAFFTQGLLDLFESTAEPRWLREAMRLTTEMAEKFEDKEGGGFYLARTPELTMQKETYDGPTPSGNSIATLNLIRLSELTGDTGFRRTAEKALMAFGTEVDRQPAGHTGLLEALDLVLNGTQEIVICAPTETDSRAFRTEVYHTFLPAKAVLTATKETYRELGAMSTLLEGRRPSSKTWAFVCQNFACKLPADSVGTLREQLAASRG